MSRLYHVSVLVLFILLSGMVMLSGCGSSGTLVADMMGLLPEDTDALFVYDHTAVQAIPEFTALWNDLNEQTLPDKASPRTMALASQEGNLVALLYTFDNTPPDYAENATPETRDYRGTTVTRTDNFWDTWPWDEITLVSVKDNTESMIDTCLDDNNSMADSPSFACLDSISLDGVLVIIINDVRIAGNQAVAGLSLDFAEDVDGLMILQGIFDFGSERKAESCASSLSVFLDDLGVTVSEITQDGSMFEVTGSIGTVNAAGLVDGLTGSW